MVGFVLGAPGVVLAFGTVAFLAVLAFVVNRLRSFNALRARNLGCGSPLPMLQLSIRPRGDA
jgi:hypothetical protein